MHYPKNNSLQNHKNKKECTTKKNNTIPKTTETKKNALPKKAIHYRNTERKKKAPPKKQTLPKLLTQKRMHYKNLKFVSVIPLSSTWKIEWERKRERCNIKQGRGTWRALQEVLSITDQNIRRSNGTKFQILQSPLLDLSIRVLQVWVTPQNLQEENT